MHISIDKMIEGVARTLIDDVLPRLTPGRERAQLWSALDLLDNLRDRVELKTEPLHEEAQAITAVLRTCSQALRAADRADDAREIEAAVEKILAEVAAEPRAAIARSALVAGMRMVVDLSTAEGTAARVALEAHLAAQVMRDIIGLKPPRLAEISRG